MSNPCSPVTRKNLVFAGTGSGLRFSSGQIGLLKQLAQESLAGFMTPRLRLHARSPSYAPLAKAPTVSLDGPG